MFLKVGAFKLEIIAKPWSKAPINLIRKLLFQFHYLAQINSRVIFNSKHLHLCTKLILNCFHFFSEMPIYVVLPLLLNSFAIWCFNSKTHFKRCLSLEMRSIEYDFGFVAYNSIHLHIHMFVSRDMYKVINW